MDLTEPQSTSGCPRWAWLRLLSGAKVATDARKLILAALGLLAMTAGWWVLDQLIPEPDTVTPKVVVGLPPAVPPGPVEFWRQALATDAAWISEPVRVLPAPFASGFALPLAGWAFLHALLAAVWVVMVWGVIGGAIARMTAVQVAAEERIGIGSALRFALGHAGRLIGAPLAPLGGITFFAVLCLLLGLFYRVPGPIAGTIASGLAFLPLLAGLIMALILVGLAVGWPLMIATVAVEGEDGFDALSRAYAYSYQRPGRYAFYVLVAWGVGTLGLLIVGTFAHLTIHLAHWGLALGAPGDRIGSLFRGFDPASTNQAPASALAFWLGLVSILVYSWIYSYFWSAIVSIYLLLRRDVDGTAWHDVYLPDPDADPRASEPSPQDIVPPAPALPAPPESSPSEPGESGPAAG